MALRHYCATAQTVRERARGWEMIQQPQMLVLSPTEWQEGGVPVCHSLQCCLPSLQLDGRAVLQHKPQPGRHSPAQGSHRSREKQAWSLPGAGSEQEFNPSNPESAWGSIRCGFLETQGCDCSVLPSLASFFYMAFCLCCSSGTDLYSQSESVVGTC